MVDWSLERGRRHRTRQPLETRSISRDKVRGNEREIQCGPKKDTTNARLQKGVNICTGMRDDRCPSMLKSIQ